MTQDARIDRLEGMMERLVSELTEIRQDMRDIRADLRSMQSTTDSKFRTMLLVNTGLWGTTVASIIGFALRGG